MQTTTAPLLLLLGALALAGCGNPYTRYYHPDEHAPTVEQVLPSTGDPTIYSGGDMRADMRGMLSNGYVPVGWSSFRAKEASGGDLMEHGRKIQADTILSYANYRNTLSGSNRINIQNPATPVTTYTTGAVSNGYSTVGYASRSTTMVPGGYTSYNIPYNIDIYDYYAIYLKKAKPPVMGVICIPIPDEVSSKIRRNRGALVDIVLRDSPAFRADIVVGDIIIGINDVEINDASQIRDTGRKFAGTTAQVKVFRDGAEKSISVQMNALQ